MAELWRGFYYLKKMLTEIYIRDSHGMHWNTFNVRKKNMLILHHFFKTAKQINSENTKYTIKSKGMEKK